MGFIHSRHLYRALLEAGLVTEPEDKVRRVSIVADVNEAVVITIERYADAGLAESLPALLKDAKVVVA